MQLVEQLSPDQIKNLARLAFHRKKAGAADVKLTQICLKCWAATKEVHVKSRAKAIPPTPNEKDDDEDDNDNLVQDWSDIGFDVPDVEDDSDDEQSE